MDALWKTRTSFVISQHAASSAAEERPTLYRQLACLPRLLVGARRLSRFLRPPVFWRTGGSDG